MLRHLPMIPGPTRKVMGRSRIRHVPQEHHSSSSEANGSSFGKERNGPAKQFLPLGLTCFVIVIPIGSMYAIYGNIYHQYTPNVSIYTIHGSYGIISWELYTTTFLKILFEARGWSCSFVFWPRVTPFSEFCPRNGGDGEVWTTAVFLFYMIRCCKAVCSNTPRQFCRFAIRKPRACHGWRCWTELGTDVSEVCDQKNKALSLRSN